MKFICTFIITVFTFTLSFSQTNKDEIFEDAYLKYERGQYREASAGFSRILQSDSLFLEAYVFRALSHHALKNTESAIDDFGKAISIAPKDTILYLMKADLEAEAGEHLLAIVDYSSAITLDPSNAEIYRGRALQYYELNHYILALEDYRKAISLEPTEATDFFSAGICLNMIEDYDDAVLYFSTASLLEPKESVIYYNRGISYSSLGKMKEACADWQKASEMGFEEAKSLIGQHCRSLGNR